MEMTTVTAALEFICPNFHKPIIPNGSSRRRKREKKKKKQIITSQSQQSNFPQRALSLSKRSRPQFVHHLVWQPVSLPPHQRRLAQGDVFARTSLRSSSRGPKRAATARALCLPSFLASYGPTYNREQWQEQQQQQHRGSIPRRSNV